MFRHLLCLRLIVARPQTEMACQKSFSLIDRSRCGSQLPSACSCHPVSPSQRPLLFDQLTRWGPQIVALESSTDSSQQCQRPYGRHPPCLQAYRRSHPAQNPALIRTIVAYLDVYGRTNLTLQDENGQLVTVDPMKSIDHR